MGIISTTERVAESTGIPVEGLWNWHDGVKSSQSILLGKDEILDNRRPRKLRIQHDAIQKIGQPGPPLLQKLLLEPVQHALGRQHGESILRLGERRDEMETQPIELGVAFADQDGPAVEGLDATVPHDVGADAGGAALDDDVVGDRDRFGPERAAGFARRLGVVFERDVAAEEPEVVVVEGVLARGERAGVGVLPIYGRYYAVGLVVREGCR